MRNQKIYMGILFFSLALFLNACRGGGKWEETNSGSNGQVIDTNKVALPPPPPPPVEVKKVNYYLENSHSMAGYYQTKTRFYDVTDRIITDLILRDRFMDKVNAFTIAEEIKPFASVDEFRAVLNPTNDTRIATATSSPLHTILKNICDESGENDVNILVTDGIISGTNEQLKRYDKPKENKYFNIDMISSIQNEIKINMDRYAGTYAIKVLAFTSNFESNKKHPYYKLDNNQNGGRVLGEFINRPYYIFLIAKSDVLAAFEAKSKRVFDSDEFLEIGFKYPEATLIPNRFSLKNKNIQIGNNEVRFSRNKSNFTFSLAVNMDIYDEKYSKEDYLRENTRLYLNGELMDGVQIVGHAINNSDNGWVRKDHNDVKKELKDFTHVIGITIPEYKPDDSDELVLKLVHQKNDWVSDWSSQNDLDIALGDNKTFGFNYLIDGILEAYGEDQENYLIDYTIPLKLK